MIDDSAYNTETNYLHPLITIITPSYNQGHFIEKTITSVLSQRNASFEYIIMDGGSTDGTIDIIKKYETQLRWISEKDDGQSDAINKGVMMAKGDIVAWINADDYLLSDALHTVENLWHSRTDIEWITGDYKIVDEKGNQIHFLIRLYKSMLRKLHPFFYLELTNAIAQPSTFFSKKIFNEVGNLDTSLHYAMDYDLWFRFMKRSKPIIVNKALAAFRIHKNAKGTLAFIRQFDEDNKILKSYRKHPGSRALHKIHNKIIINMYRIMKQYQNKNIKYFIKNIPIINTLIRFRLATSYLSPKYFRILRWLFTSSEYTNFTYDITDSNVLYLTHTIAHICGLPFDTIWKYMEEIRNNPHLDKHIGRRLGWYAMARAIKPRVIVETGVEKGLGSVVLTLAIIKNKQEGHSGTYYGTDIDPAAGILFQKPYNEHGKIIYGDSLTTLKSFDQTIDLFINDSDHSADYEYAEYLAIHNKLSRNAVILGDNAHATTELARYSKEYNRTFLFFNEVPKNHWYPGAGIGFSFKNVV